MNLWEKCFGTKETGYDYGSLCMPTVPCSKNKVASKLYPVDEPLPYFIAMVMGLQHAFAMIGGLITPPYVVFRFTVTGFPWGDEADALAQYAIVAALITSGICTIIQVSHIEIPFSKSIFGKPLYLGSGVLSVMGTSFTFLPIFELAINQMKADGVDPLVAYGKMLGTSMICGLLEVFISILPRKLIKAFFPPIVCATAVTLIGVALTGTGMKYWGGGVVCAEEIWKQNAQVVDSVGPTFQGYAVSNIPSAICSNGQVQLPYGSTEFIGLGFTVLCSLVVIEMFGSTFMKNCNVIIALMIGYLFAIFSEYEGAQYVDDSKIELAPVVDFLWTETFPLGFYAPAVLPLLIGYLVTTVETVGDITAVHETSELSTEGEKYDERIQGGILSDGICSILSGLFTSMPNTTFSQNTGVIALTRVASRRAGFACGIWLILMGVLAKIAGLISSIPDCVLGGMTIFLFCNVLVSGISLYGALDFSSRRVRFITAMSLCVGVGVTVFPFAFQDQRASPYTAAFWTCSDCEDSMKGLRNGVSIFLSTGYCIGTVICIILNFIIPGDASAAPKDEKESPVLEKAVEASPVIVSPVVVPDDDFSEEVEC